jgi:K+-transporting ATPase ATPase A chain
MSSLEIVQIVLYLVLLVAITPLLGGYMKQVFDGERNILTPVLRPIERLIYRLSSVRPEVGTALEGVHAGPAGVQRPRLPAAVGDATAPGHPAAQPRRAARRRAVLAFNTATSFMTNTNWQAYAGETTMS